MRNLILALTLACTPSPPEPEVHFSPNGGCTEMIVRHINGAKTSIHVLAYSFTSPQIATALAARPAITQVVLDRSDTTGKGTQLPLLQTSNVPVRIDSKHAIAHNKVIIIDATTVLTGSFNFTAAAETHNAENCIAIKNPSLAAKYLADWQTHWNHSK